MTQISIRLVGADKVQTAFNKYAQSVRTITRDDALKAMERARKRSVSDGPYGAYTPPERGYVRTGNLKASTYIETDGLSFRIKSEAMRRAKQASVSDPAGGPYTVPERGYIRTGNLSASTYLEEDGLSFRIKSEAMRDGRPYSVYVIGSADGYGQAQVHVGYWKPLRESVDEQVEKLMEDLDKDLQDSAEALGL